MKEKCIAIIAAILLLTTTLSSCALPNMPNETDGQTEKFESETESETERETDEGIRDSESISENETADTESNDESDTEKNEESEKEEESDTSVNATETEPPLKEYTISFDMNFEGAPTPTAQTLLEGERISIPPSPIRDGYIFSGWFCDKTYSSAFDFSSDIYEDITLYALWQGEEYIARMQKKQDELGKMQVLGGGKLPKIAFSEDGCSVSSILGKFSSTKVTDFASALLALNDIKALLGFDNAEKEFIDAGHTLLHGSMHFRLQQISGGYSVFGKQLVISTDLQGNITSLSGDYARETSNFKSSINLTKDDAASIFSEKGFGYPIAYDGTRIIYRHNGHDEYAYLFDKGGTCAIISAFDGKVLDSFSNIMYALPKKDADITQTFGREQSTSTELFPTTLYEFSSDGERVFLMYDAMRNIVYHDLLGKKIDTSLPLWEYEYYNTPPLSDGDNVWNSDAGKVASKLCLALGDVYDFYFEKLGLYSFDGQRGQILVFMNDGSLQKDNALCSPKLTIKDNATVILSFGRTDGKEIAFDTVAHEFSHAIHEDIVPDLCKSGESGAIAEAYAYIMSKLICLEKRGYADWSKLDTTYTECQDIHAKAVNVSKILYNIYKKLDDVDTATQLFYNAWFYMTDTADLEDYKMALTASARSVGVSEEIIESVFEDLGVSSSELCDNTLGTLSLCVSDINSNEKLENVRIYIKTNDLAPVTELYTENNGNATFTLDFGLYILVAEADGYEKESVEICISPENNSSISIEMKALFAPY